MEVVEEKNWLTKRKYIRRFVIEMLKIFRKEYQRSGDYYKGRWKRKWNVIRIGKIEVINTIREKIKWSRKNKLEIARIG